jgi:hypothetical protein
MSDLVKVVATMWKRINNIQTNKQTHTIFLTEKYLKLPLAQGLVRR